MITVIGVEEIERKLKGLDSAVQVKLLRKVANKIASISKKRITQQTDLTGTAFKARSKNTDEKLARKKMLVGLRKRLRVLSVTNERAEIGFVGRTEQIAADQQYGNKRVGTAAENRRLSSGKRDLPASKKQAMILLDLGYVVKNKKPTVSWIISHLTLGKAGIIIKEMRLKRGIRAKERWDIVTPARSFLGVNQNDEKELLQLMADEINQEINR